MGSPVADYGDDNDNGDNISDDADLDSNSVVELQQKMKRTTISVRSYPPVTEPSRPNTSSLITTSNTDAEVALSIITTSNPPFVPSHPVSHFVSHLGFGPRTAIPYSSFNSSNLPTNNQFEQPNFELFQRMDFLRLTKIPSSPPPPPILSTAPVAVPLPPFVAETSFPGFPSQLQNSGVERAAPYAPNEAHFRGSGRTGANAEGTGGAAEQREAQIQEPVDDILGCAWDIVTSSCKDLFLLKLCLHCHDFGNIFLHNCKCLAKFSTVL